MSIIRADSIKNRAGNGAPDFPNGITVTGVITATTISQTVSGDLTVNGSLGVGGTITYEDVKSVDSIGIITARTDVLVGSTIKLGASSGIVTATSYRGDGSQLTGISVGLATESMSPSGITTHLDLSKDDHKVLATGNVTIDVTGGTEADNHQVRIENVGVATVGFSTAFKFPSGGTPSLPTASGSFSLITFTIHKVGAAGTILFAGASVDFS